VYFAAVVKKASLITGGNLVAKVRLLDEEDAVRNEGGLHMNNIHVKLLSCE